LYALATTQLSYLLYAEPKKVKNKEMTAHQLAKLLSESPEKSTDQNFEYGVLFEKYKKLLNLDLYWVGLERGLSPTQKEEIEALKLENIGFEDHPDRYYPENELASHVLGFVASNDSGQKQGYFGVEGLFDRDLRGKPGRIIEEKDALGEPILVGGHTKVAAIDGSDIYLTIDRAVQYIVEKNLKEGVEKYNAASGTVIVMDPKTGDVLAFS
jgi:cell division protein FtsI/penicillin-binding protein 2